MRLLHHIPYLYAYWYICFWQPLLFLNAKMPKRKSKKYYTELAKRQFTNTNSDISTWVSLDTNLHVDHTRVSVDTNSRINAMVGSKKRLTFYIRNYGHNYDCNEDFTRKLRFVITKTTICNNKNIMHVAS